MKNALQAQLLKAGLVDSKKVKKINKQVAHAKRTGDESVNEAKKSVEQAKAEKIAKDQQLNQQKQQALEDKTLKANIIQMINQHQVKDDGNIADSNVVDDNKVGYNFVDGTKVKKLNLSPKLYEQVVAGHVLIARLEEEVSEHSQYALLPHPLANRINSKLEGFIINTTDKAENIPVEDDPYAEYVIPDDLMW